MSQPDEPSIVTPLRFGILVDRGLRFAQWEADCLRRLLALPDVWAALLIRRDRRAPAPRTPWPFLESLCRSPSLRIVDLAGLLGSTPSVPIHDDQTIRGQQLDFILHFGVDHPGAGISDAAKFGVWGFAHHDDRKPPGVSEGFWEIVDDEPVAFASLRRLTGTPGESVTLRRGCVAVANHCWRKTRSILLTESARWPAQVCIDIRNGVANYLNETPMSKPTGPVRRACAAARVKLFARMLANFTNKALSELFVDETWQLGIIDCPVERLLQSPTPAIRPVENSAGPYRFVADPFVIDADSQGTIHLLFEELDLRLSTNGAIRYGHVIAGRLQGVQPAISARVHASYPFVFRENGQLYCLPETAGANELSAYRSLNGNTEWARQCVLIENFPALDATLFQYENRWWIAATSLAHGQFHNLYLFHADNPFGPYQPHANNPVKCDARSTRPAGNMFVVDGRLYRPGQDCSGGYGRAVTINRIETLSPTEFFETEAAVVKPDGQSKWVGLHTLAGAGKSTIVDLKRERIDPFKPIKTWILFPLLRRRR